MKSFYKPIISGIAGGLFGALSVGAVFIADALMPQPASAEMLNQTGKHYTGGNSYNYGKYYDQPSYKQKPWKGTQIRDREGNSWNCPTYSSTCRPE